MMSSNAVKVRAQMQIEPVEPRRLMARPLGIDVSDFQGDITVAEWGQIIAAGKSFAFAKATEGVTFTASTFDENITRAPQAGMPIGAYHYGRPDNNSATAEADHFISRINPYLTAGYIRPVLDIEVDAGDVTFMSNWVNEFCNRVKTVTGITPLVYTGQFFASSNFNSSVTQWPLWIARYPSPTPDPQTASPGSTTPWSTWNFWQYTASGSVPGIAGNVDLNVFNGEPATLTNNFVIKPPKATVLRNITNIPDGQTTPIDFGTVTQGQPGPSITFTVRNDGQQKLTLGAPVVPVGFVLTEPLAANLLAGQADTFTAQLSSATVGVKSGNIGFTTNDPTPGANVFNFAVTGNVISADPIPPAVVGSEFLFETAPHRMTVEFSENVQPSLSPFDFQFTNLTTGGSVSPLLQYDAITNIATLNFGGVIADGNYRLRINANAVQDPAGNVMAAPYEFFFHVLGGDADWNKTVDIDDFGILAMNFNTPGTFSDGDFDYSGTVDIDDFSILATQFNVNLPSAEASPRGLFVPALPDSHSWPRLSVTRLIDDEALPVA